MTDDIRFVLGELAVEHYAAARLAFHNTGLRITGHLFHRSLEYALKAALIRDTPLERLKRLGHSLVRLHKEAIRRAPMLDTPDHRATIQRLDRWEKIRYPSLPGKLGRAIVVSPFLFPDDWPGITSVNGARFDAFEVIIQDVDVLFADILHLASLNPAAFFPRLSPLAREHVVKFNRAKSIVGACEIADVSAVSPC